MSKKKQQRQSLLHGAFILVAATALVKVIGAIYKIPINILLRSEGYGYYSAVYAIYMPIYVLAVAGLPVAIARLVAAENTRGHYRDIRKILRITRLFFCVSGTIGSLFLFFGADMLMGQKEAVLAMRCMAPTLFLVCGMSAFRGYYEGLRNMYPTAISQVIEAVGKLVFGLGLAYLPIYYGNTRFEAGQTVFGQVVATEEELAAVCIPYATAGAICGVTIGAFFGLIYLMLHYKISGDGITDAQLLQSPAAAPAKTIFKNLLAISLPIAIGSIAMNITTPIDYYTVQSGLETAIKNGESIIQSLYASVLETQTTLEKLPVYLYGLYNTAYTLYNLVPTIALSFGVSALPAVTQAWTMKNKLMLQGNIERALRVTALLAFPGGIGLFALAEPIVTMLYSGMNDPGALVIAASMLRVLGLTTIISAICNPMSSILQGMGRADLPVKFVFGGLAIKLLTNYLLIRIPSVNIMGAAIGTAVYYLFVFSGDLWMVIRLSGIKFRVVQTFVKPLVAALFCGVGAWASYDLLNGRLGLRNRISTLSAILIACIIYMIALFALKTIEKDDILSFPKGKKLASLLEKLKLIS